MLASYLDDVTECQGELFAEASKYYKMDFFVPFFLNSTIRWFIDIPMPRYATMSGFEMLEWMEKNEGLKVHRGRYKYDSFKAEWLGCWYSMLQYALGCRSMNLIQICPYQVINQHYNVLHDLDMKLAINRFCKSNNLVCEWRDIAYEIRSKGDC